MKDGQIGVDAGLNANRGLEGVMTRRVMLVEVVVRLKGAGRGQLRWLRWEPVSTWTATGGAG